MIAATSERFLVPSCARPGMRSMGLTLASTRDATWARARRTWVRAVSDIRDADTGELAGYDAVVCLAALSNDPLGDLNPAATYSVNLEGTLRLARAAKQAGVERFLFASSCSLYGAAGSAAVAEDADLFPVTPYGEAKVVAERELSLLADDAFSPTYLRNATAYGASPRLRLDIVVNNLTAVAVTTGAGAPGKRRVAVAAAGARRGHQPGVPRGAGGPAGAGA